MLALHDEHMALLHPRHLRGVLEVPKLRPQENGCHREETMNMLIEKCGLCHVEARQIRWYDGQHLNQQCQNCREKSSREPTRGELESMTELTITVGTKGNIFEP